MPVHSHMHAHTHIHQCLDPTKLFSYGTVESRMWAACEEEGSAWEKFELKCGADKRDRCLSVYVCDRCVCAPVCRERERERGKNTGLLPNETSVETKTA